MSETATGTDYLQIGGRFTPHIFHPANAFSMKKNRKVKIREIDRGFGDLVETINTEVPSHAVVRILSGCPPIRASDISHFIAERKIERPELQLFHLYTMLLQCELTGDSLVDHDDRMYYMLVKTPTEALWIVQMDWQREGWGFSANPESVFDLIKIRTDIGDPILYRG